jgi:hypothetical protein
MRAGFGRVDGQGFVGVEVQVALDGETERAAEIANLAHADEAQFRASHAEICEAEGDVVEPELLGPRLRSAVHASLRSGRAIHVSAFAGMRLTHGPRPAGPPKVGSKRLLPF